MNVKSLFLTLLATLFNPLFAAIEMTVIAPEPGSEVRANETDFEGLISDLQVSELKLLVNAQKIQFVPVKKGYFKTTIKLDQRDNRIAVYGASLTREYFQQEFYVVNANFREKSEEEKVPPRLEVPALVEGKLNLLSPKTFASLYLKCWDNKGRLAQVAYVLDGVDPVYLKLDEGRASLPLKLNPERRAHSLHLYAIDEDGNRTAKNYNFRVEELGCSVQLSPGYGLYNLTEVFLQASVQGGVPPLVYKYTLQEASGLPNVSTTASTSEVLIRPIASQGHLGLFAKLVIQDKNGIEAECVSDQQIHLYPSNYPGSFELYTIKLQSIRQNIGLRVLPPIKSGEVSVLLKKVDALTGVTGQEWKVLGNKTLESKDYQRDWILSLDKRLPVGFYQMKLSLILDPKSQMNFTSTTDVEVTRSQDDTVELLQEILKDEER